MVTLPIKDEKATFHMIEAPMRDNYGNIIGLCGITRDVTDRQMADEQFRGRTVRGRNLRAGLSLRRDAGNIESGSPGRSHRYDGAAHRRNRHREGLYIQVYP